MPRNCSTRSLASSKVAVATVQHEGAAPRPRSCSVSSSGLSLLWALSLSACSSSADPNLAIAAAGAGTAGSTAEIEMAGASAGGSAGTTAQGGMPNGGMPTTGSAGAAAGGTAAAGTAGVAGANTTPEDMSTDPDAGLEPPLVNPPASGVNLFVNPGFDTDVEGWVRYSQFDYDDFVFEMDDGDGVARAQIGDHEEAGRDINSLHLYQTFTASGGTYTLQFGFRKLNENMRNVEVLCAELDNIENSFGSMVCAIGIEPSTCTATCKPPAGTEVTFGMRCGDELSDFFIDDASLVHE